MKHDNTPLTNEIYTKTYAVPGEHGTPLNPKMVRMQARTEGRGFKAELGPGDKEGWSDDEGASSNTERVHKGIAIRYTGMTDAQRAEEQQRLWNERCADARRPMDGDDYETTTQVRREQCEALARHLGETMVQWLSCRTDLFSMGPTEIQGRDQ